MSTRAEKLLKAQKDRHHTILRELVQELPNKTCADCLAKGPRWASWNIGVFVCIRCAGIHRNLGVHISKIKSIDLDSWTLDQIENFLKWGNQRAALYYECYLPKDFTRPQGNQAVETFIRNKYEKKLYIKKDGEPEENSVSKYADKLKGATTTEKENKPTSGRRRERTETKPEDKAAEKTILNIAKKAAVPEVTATVEEPAKLSVTPHHVKSSSMNDLMCLGNDASQQLTKPSATTDDLLNFGAFTDPIPQSHSTEEHNLNDIIINTNSSETANGDTAKSTKESILSLYSSGSSNQQKMYGIPGGVYMQQQLSQQGNMMYGYPQQSMPNQMHQMNTQMQQINLNANKQMLMAHQSNPYNQQSVMNQFGSSGQPAFATPMYTSNSNMMANQMNSVYQHQKFQTSSNIQNRAQPIMTPHNSTGNYANTMGHNMGANVGWTGNEHNMMGMLNQPSLMGNNNSQAGNFNMNSGHIMNGNAGFTMNNQLWN